jgi:hypothetical protein
MKKTAVAALTLLLTAAAYADFPDMPPMKEGLWKIHMVDNTTGQKPTDTTYSLCRDHAWDQQARQLSQKVLSSCTTSSDVKSGDTRTMVTSCKVAGTTITTKSILTSRGDTYFHNESFSTFTPPLYGQSQDSMIQEQTFVGACPAGMKPGDHQLPDGTIQHRH